MLVNVKALSLVLAMNIVAGGTYALATQDTATNSPAVYQTSMVLGYDVTGILFDLDDTDPTNIDTISFQIAPSNGFAKVRHVEIQTEKDGAWTKCSLVDAVLPARIATCTFESLAAEDVTEINIAAE
ncbi:MAG TPA: hypothetical protein VFQ13_07600 [Anaerolineales bacterium]|nr:hypothetical protein [Anaerolineales bacterium]